MALAIDCVKRLSIDCKDEEFLSAIKRLKENVSLLPHDVSDDEKYNSEDSGLEYKNGQYYTCNDYQTYIYEINEIIGFLWHEYRYIPTEYLELDFFNTKYFKNFIDNQFLNPLIYLRYIIYPQANLRDIKMLAENTCNVIVPLDMINKETLYSDFSSDKLERIDEDIQKFNNLMFYYQKVYIMCHYRYIDFKKMLNSKELIYWPGSLENVRDMFEYQIVNNLNIYNEISQLRKSIDQLYQNQQQQINAINKLVDCLINVNNNINDALTKQYLEIAKTLLNNVSSYTEMVAYPIKYPESVINDAWVHGVYLPKYEYDYRYGGRRQALIVKTEVAANSSEQRKEKIASQIRDDMTKAVEIKDRIICDEEKIPYLNSRVDTPIVFSTQDIFSNADQIATIGLCFGKNIKEKDLKTKKLVLKERSFYKKIKITY